MWLLRTSLLKCTIVLVFISGLSAQSPLTIWYNKPANTWVEALPVGNGRIGAMIFGGVESELIQLNESTLYSGGPVSRNVNPHAAENLPLIRKALLEEEDYSKANELAKKMQGLFTESYLPLGDLRISQDLDGAAVQSYYRDLNIGDAVATTGFTANNVKYKREIFTSAPANLLVIRFTADTKGALKLHISGNSQLRYNVSTNANDLLVSGKAPAHVDPSYYNPPGRQHVVYDDMAGCKGMRFQYRIRPLTKDGKLHTDTSGIHVTGASELVLYIAAATSFNGFNKCPDSQGKDEKKIVDSLINAGLKKQYAALFNEHVKDYRKYFDRVSFAVRDTSGRNPSNNLATDERLKAYSEGAYDPSFETLYFQFGRYLLISASRPGGPPANLQGIWNKELRAPWSSNYTININTQMNYWPAEVTNLSEMHMPLMDWLKGLSQTGANTAKEFYGADGWVAHHNSDIWCLSNPVGDVGNGDPLWANWYMGGAWLCQHLWEHYAFTGDKNFLIEAYPVMKGAARFALDWLVEDKNGFLVTAPSTSPENAFKDKNGKAQSVSVASTMDMSIIWDLFTNVIEASETLKDDEQFRDTLIAKRKKLYPLKIGSKGQLQEWYKDFEEVDPLHRHASHLFGLHPGRQISPSDNKFFQAAKKSLQLRGDEGTGWSRGWKINWWARLRDGDHAYTLVRQLLKYVGENDSHGGTYPNLFDAHPPFQIDGNFAGTSGMAEMLLQSHLHEIHLLPALPTAWHDGEIKGLVARGGFVTDIQWQRNKLARATVKALNDRKCKIRASVPFEIKSLKLKAARDGDEYVLEFNAVKGKSYLVVPQ